MFLRKNNSLSILDKLKKIDGYKAHRLLLNIETQYKSIWIYENDDKSDLIFFSYYGRIDDRIRDEDGFADGGVAYKVLCNLFISFRVKPEHLIRYLYGNFGRSLLLKLSNQNNVLLHRIPAREDFDALDSKDVITYRISKKAVFGELSLGTTEFRDLETDDKGIIQGAINTISAKFGVNFPYQPDYQYDYSGLGLTSKDMDIPCFFKELVSIDYSRNKIKEIPKWFTSWRLTTELEKINLSRNLLSDRAKYNFILDLETGGWSERDIDKIVF